MLTEEEVAAVVETLARYARPHQILLFGSAVKGTPHAGSDLDVMVVMDTHLRGRARSDALNHVVSGYSVPIDVHVTTPEEFETLAQVQFSFLESVRSTGRVVYTAPTSRAVGE